MTFVEALIPCDIVSPPQGNPSEMLDQATKPALESLLQCNRLVISFQLPSLARSFEQALIENFGQELEVCCSSSLIETFSVLWQDSAV